MQSLEDLKEENLQWKYKALREIKGFTTVLIQILSMCFNYIFKQPFIIHLKTFAGNLQVNILDEFSKEEQEHNLMKVIGFTTLFTF